MIFLFKICDHSSSGVVVPSAIIDHEPLTNLECDA